MDVDADVSRWCVQAARTTPGSFPPGIPLLTCPHLLSSLSSSPLLSSSPNPSTYWLFIKLKVIPAGGLVKIS